jgi:hypothetical protein
MTNKLRTYLPKNLREHIQVANFKNGTLIIHTDSSIWASQLRFLNNDIISCCNNDELFYPRVDKIQIKVQSLLSNEKKQIYKTCKTVSTKNIDILNSVAKNTSYKPLQEALFNLAKSANLTSKSGL